MKKIQKSFFDAKDSQLNMFKRQIVSTSEYKQEMMAHTLQSGQNSLTEIMMQRDFMSKKITSISRLNKQSEMERDDGVTKVQNENTHLLGECNLLREERQQNKEVLL